MKKVYVVILNWNGLNDTIECLDSLKKINYPDYKIVVVDNGSDNNEGVKIKEKFPEVHLIIKEKNEGIDIAANLGIDFGLKSGADYILFLNNDTVVSPDFLNVLIDYAEKDEKAGAIGPKMLYYDSDKIWFNGGMVWWWIGFNRHLERLVGNKESKILNPREVDYICGCCVLMKKEALEKVGLLDPIYFTQYEDVDWSIRLKKAGYKNVVVPSATIRHKVSSTLGLKGSQRLSKSQAFYGARNGIIFGRKHFSGLKKIIFLASQLTIRLGYNLIISKDNEARMAYFKGIASGINIKLNQ